MLASPAASPSTMRRQRRLTIRQGRRERAREPRGHVLPRIGRPPGFALRAFLCAALLDAHNFFPHPLPGNSGGRRLHRPTISQRYPQPDEVHTKLSPWHPTPSLRLVPSQRIVMLNEPPKQRRPPRWPRDAFQHLLYRFLGRTRRFRAFSAFLLLVALISASSRVQPRNRGFDSRGPRRGAFARPPSTTFSWSFPESAVFRAWL